MAEAAGARSTAAACLPVWSELRLGWPHPLRLGRPQRRNPQGAKYSAEPSCGHAMEGWVTDEAVWPRNRTLEMFGEWLEVQMCSIVEDLDLDERLEYVE